jgi:hypothetical protein
VAVPDTALDAEQARGLTRPHRRMLDRPEQRRR